VYRSACEPNQPETMGRCYLARHPRPYPQDDVSNRNVSPDVASALAAAKNVFAIINGLALTNTLLILVTAGRYSRVMPLNRLGAENIAFAVVLMVNIVRFYHGNVRHLDAAYGSESVGLTASGRQAEPRGGFGLDYFVIFGQSLLFSIASFYVISHSEYISLFIALLAFDVIWTVYAERTSDDGGDAPSPQRNWLLNNLVAVLFLVVLSRVHGAHPSGRSWALDAALTVLAITTAIDFGLNWGFYFPATRQATQGLQP
jgi:hypothetical protein